MLAPATLAALPSTRAIPDRDVFYVAYAIRSVREQTGMLQIKAAVIRFCQGYSVTSQQRLQLNAVGYGQ